MYHRVGFTAARLLHVCFRKKSTFGSTFVAHSGTFWHIRAHSGKFGDSGLRARPTKTNVFAIGRQEGWHIRRSHPFFFIILKRGHGARCRRQSRRRASRILHRARGRASFARSTASIHRPHGRPGEWQCHILSICSASKWATFRIAMFVAFFNFTYRGPHGAAHPNYIRFADATRTPGKAVRASVARPSPPFPSPGEADPLFPSQTRRKGASNIKQTFAPVCNRQVRKFLNIWRTC